MSRFFRTIRPFIRTIGNVSTPLCVSFGVASTVPTTADVPPYVQEVFNEYNKDYDQNTQRVFLEDIPYNTHEDNEEPIPSEQQQPEEEETVEFQQESEEQIESEPEPEQLTELIKPLQTEDKQPISSTSNPTQYLSRFIDHTVLKPKSSEQDIRKMCAEAIQYDFFSVCCNPCWVSLCRELLENTNVKICCVVGFPLGSNTTQIKVLEAQQAVNDGANEIDMVMNIGKGKSGNWDFVRNDIAMVVASVPEDVAVKVILETCLLSDDEVIEACKCAVDAGAKFVKTSTGFGGGGATVHHVSLMRKCVDEESINLGMDVGSVLVKASGGIRDSEKAKEMIDAGADRIGASSGIKIIGAVDALVANTVSSEEKKQEQY